MTSFRNQNLQARSFRQQVLNGADFRGADIRGCNFNQAQLAGANFERVKAGLSPQKFARLSSLTIAIALLVGDALSRLIFGALGQIPNSSAWSFVLVLYGVLSLAGVSAGISSFKRIPLKTSRLAGTFSAVLSGALLGFFMLEVRRETIQLLRSGRYVRRSGDASSQRPSSPDNQNRDRHYHNSHQLRSRLSAWGNR